MQAPNPGEETEEPKGKTFGPIRMVPGVTKINMAAFMFAAFTTIGLLSFIATATPFVLNANLGISGDEQGRYVGDFQVFNEIILLLIFAPAGILADRLGRRGVFAVGLLAMGVGYTIYPFATSIFELTIFRAIYAIGIALATGMMQTVIADYPQGSSRGKLVALVGVFNGIGVVVVNFTIARLPGILANAGTPPLDAGRYAHWAAAGLCVLTAIVVGFGLKKGTPHHHGADKPALKETVMAGIVEGQRPQIALAYAAGFVAIAQRVIVGTFVTLWAVRTGIDMGLDPARAAERGGRLFGIVMLAGLLWLPILGPMLDRINRIAGVTVCLAISTAGFLCTALIDDPLKPVSLALFAFTGIGQISAFLGATVLITHEAPLKTRGAVVGMFNMFGAAGTLVSVLVGGRIFDRIDPSAPFVFVGLMTLVVMLMGIYVQIRHPEPPPQRI